MEDQLAFGVQGREPPKERPRRVVVPKQEPGLPDAAGIDPSQPSSSSSKSPRNRTQAARQNKPGPEAPKPLSKPVIKESFQELEIRHVKLQQESRNLKALASQLGVPMPASQDAPSPRHSPADLGRRLQMEQMQLAFCILDVSEMNFQIQYASPEFCRLSGYPASSLVNLSYRDLPCSPMINLSKYRKLEVALRFRRDESVEMVHQLLDGKQFYSLVLVTHLPTDPTARPFVVALYSNNSVSPMCTPDVPYRTMLTKQLSLSAGLPPDKGSLASSPRMYTGVPARARRLSVLSGGGTDIGGVHRSASADHYLSPADKPGSVSGILSSGHVNIPPGMVLAPYPRTHRPSILRALSSSASLPFPAPPSIHIPSPLHIPPPPSHDSPGRRLHGGFGSHSSMSTGSALTRNSSFCSTGSGTTDLGADPQLCADFTRCGMENRITTMEDRAANYFEGLAESSNSGVTTNTTNTSNTSNTSNSANNGSSCGGNVSMGDTGIYSADMVLSSKSAELPVIDAKTKVQKRKGKHALQKVTRARSTSEVNDVVLDAQGGVYSGMYGDIQGGVQGGVAGGVQGSVQVGVYSSVAPLSHADNVVAGMWVHAFAPPAGWGVHAFDTFPLRAALPHSDTTLNTPSNTTEVHPREHLSATTSVEMDEDSDGAFEFLSGLFD